MNKTHKIRYILIGVLITVLFSQLCVPALAALAQKTIDVYTGVNIYVDDVKFNPTDANGNPVEVFLYNGTTYLPVRAVGEVYGKAVQWDGSTQSVYLGQHSSETPAILLQDLDYFAGEDWVVETSDKDNLGNVYTSSIILPADRMKVSNTYKINGQYSRMTGTLYQRNDYQSGISSTTTNLTIYGDGELLFNGTVGIDSRPIYFDLDLTGVQEINVILTCKNMVQVAAIGDCGLYT